MNIGICDDEKICLDRMIECLDKASKALETEFQYKSFLSGEELLKSNENIDILFLDVEMDGISGIETMRLLESKENVKFIIFASSHSEYVFESFGTKTMGFLCKPVEYEKVLKEIKKVIEKINAKKQIEPVEINVDGRNVFISPEDIVYISGEKNYVKVSTIDSDSVDNVGTNLEEFRSGISDVLNWVNKYKMFIILVPSIMYILPIIFLLVVLYKDINFKK